MWIHPVLDRLVREGDLRVRDWRGRERRYGDGSGAPVSITIADPGTDRRLFLNPYLALGEAYMDGGVVLEEGGAADLLEVICRNLGADLLTGHPLHRLARRLRRGYRRVQQSNPVARARRNAAHHYDLSGELYELFLDSDRQYSCALFERENDSLERAQEQKKRHIAAKLLIEPGMRVLDIGCGWGGLAIYLARECDARVVGITLSEEQARIAAERVAAEGLEDRIEIRLQDYRDIDGPFDRIVSIGMFEHVGVYQYDTYMHANRDLLTEDGIALLHHIARATEPGTANPWIAKYIFPGSYCPALSEVVPSIERAGLYMTDLEVWRLHYAKTLQHWRARFMAARDKAARLYDERFCRMWEFYLAASEMAFRFGGHMVAQIQMSPSQRAVPLTRDYIAEFKAAHPVRAN